MLILQNLADIDSVKLGALAARDKCNGIECCGRTDDSGWSSVPEADLNS